MKNINSTKVRKELIEKYHNKRSRIFTIDCFRSKDPAEVKIIYTDGKVETITGPKWAITKFYTDFRREILNIRT